MLNTRSCIREGTNERTYSTTKHITTLLLRGRVKTSVLGGMREVRYQWLFVYAGDKIFASSTLDGASS